MIRPFPEPPLLFYPSIMANHICKEAGISPKF
jgi:hypothetical protein